MSRADSPLKDRMAFLVGARRSGTNWLERIVAAHPDVVGMPAETHLFSHGIAPLRERVQHATPGVCEPGLAYMDQDAFLDSVRDFCDRLFGDLADMRQRDAALIAERTPWHVEHLPLIADVYPDARVVHIIRDGRDVVRSLLTQPWGPKTVREAAEEWRRSVEAGRRDGAGLERYLEVRYEEMLADPAPHVRRLYEWLGLEAGEPVVAAALTEAGVHYNVDPSANRVAAGKWRDSFSKRDLATVEEVAGHLLDELGYARLGVSRPSPVRNVARTGRRALETARRPRAAIARLGEVRFGRRVTAEVERNQQVFARFLECVHTGKLGELETLMRPDALVRLVAADGEWSGRGAPARERLITALESDAALRGRQIRADLHPSLTDFLAIATYELDDGSRADRSFVVVIRRQTVRAVSFYTWPASLAAQIPSAIG